MHYIQYVIYSISKMSTCAKTEGTPSWTALYFSDPAGTTLGLHHIQNCNMIIWWLWNDFDNHYHLNLDLLQRNRNEDHHFHFIFFCKKVKTHLNRTAEGCGKFEEAEEAASGRNVCAVTIMENYHYCNHDYYHYWHFNCHLFVFIMSWINKGWCLFNWPYL